MDWKVVLASAATAALVSSLFQIFGQWAERRHRRQELLMKLAIDAARNRIDQLKWIREQTGNGLNMRDEVYLAADYYPIVKNILTKGRLRQKDIDHENASADRIGAKLRRNE